MGRIMAGLLSGFGQGLQLVGQQQHEAAMENLRNQRQIEQEDRAEARDNRKSDRENKEKIGLLGLAQMYKQAEGETEFQYKVRLEKIKADIESNHIAQKGQVDTNIAILKASLDAQNDEASQRLKARLDRELPSLHGFTRDANGNLVLVYKDGSQSVTNINAPSDAQIKASIPRSGQPAPQKPSTLEPGTYVPGGAPSGGGNAWYMGNNSGQPSSSDVGNSSPTVITQAQLAQTARDMNMTVVQAKRWAEANGFKIK